MIAARDQARDEIATAKDFEETLNKTIDRWNTFYKGIATQPAQWAAQEDEIVNLGDKVSADYKTYKDKMKSISDAIDKYNAEAEAFRTAQVGKAAAQNIDLTGLEKGDKDTQKKIRVDIEGLDKTIQDFGEYRGNFLKYVGKIKKGPESNAKRSDFIKGVQDPNIVSSPSSYADLPNYLYIRTIFAADYFDDSWVTIENIGDIVQNKGAQTYSLGNVNSGDLPNGVVDRPFSEKQQTDIRDAIQKKLPDKLEPTGKVAGDGETDIDLTGYKYFKDDNLISVPRTPGDDLPYTDYYYLSGVAFFVPSSRSNIVNGAAGPVSLVYPFQINDPIASSLDYIMGIKNVNYRWGSDSSNNNFILVWQKVKDIKTPTWEAKIQGGEISLNSVSGEFTDLTVTTPEQVTEEPTAITPFSFPSGETVEPPEKPKLIEFEDDVVAPNVELNKPIAPIKPEEPEYPEIPKVPGPPEITPPTPPIHEEHPDMPEEPTPPLPPDPPTPPDLVPEPPIPDVPDKPVPPEPPKPPTPLPDEPIEPKAPEPPEAPTPPKEPEEPNLPKEPEAPTPPLYHQEPLIELPKKPDQPETPKVTYLEVPNIPNELEKPTPPSKVTVPPETPPGTPPPNKSHVPPTVPNTGVKVYPKTGSEDPYLLTMGGIGLLGSLSFILALKQKSAKKSESSR